MAKKRKNNQAHPQRSFENIVADATLQRLGGYIDQQIQGVGRAVSAQTQRSMANILTRLQAVEEVLGEKLEVSKEELANRVAAIQDEVEGFEQRPTDAQVNEGDRIRFEIKTKTIDQVEFQGSSRMQLDDAGSGKTLGKELEAALVGMKAGDLKEIKFGKDESLVASLRINRISYKPMLAANSVSSKNSELEKTNANAHAG